MLKHIICSLLQKRRRLIFGQMEPLGQTVGSSENFMTDIDKIPALLFLWFFQIIQKKGLFND